MKNEKSEFMEVISDMSQFAGALAGAAVTAGKELMSYINELIIVEPIKPSADEERKSETKSR